MIKKGDILVTSYRLDPVAWFIRFFTESQWNHVALVINEKEVLEAKPRGIFINPIKKYQNRFLYNTVFVRPIGVDKKDINSIIAIGKKQIGIKKRRKWLVTLICLLLTLPYAVPRLTCSGLIGYLFWLIKFQFTDKIPDTITPEDIYSSKNVRRL